MGLDWNFVRITPEQYTRLLSDPTYETLEAIHNERFDEGLGDVFSPSDDDQPAASFEEVYHLGIRTDYDELDTLMTFEEDDGPVVTWPLGESGVQLSAMSDTAYLLDPEEIRAVAPTLQLLLDSYLEQRYLATVEDLGKEAPDLEEIYPELRKCFADLTHFVQTAARHGDAIFWDLS